MLYRTATWIATSNVTATGAGACKGSQALPPQASLPYRGCYPGYFAAFTGLRSTKAGASNRVIGELIGVPLKFEVFGCAGANLELARLRHHYRVRRQ